MGARQGRVGPVDRKGVAVLVLAMLMGGCSTLTGEPPPARSQDGVLVDASGMTLYTFDRDPSRVRRSACAAECARNWPPFAAPAGAKPLGDYTPVRREDGSVQWAYKGKPLYLSSKDRSPGDRNGDGVGNLWRLARP